jgi:hypothetical protein
MAEANLNKENINANNGKTEIIIDELLCFLMNNFAKVPKANILAVIANFYSVDEIIAGKRVLFTFAESVSAEGLPRFINRKEGDKKRRLDVEDIYNLAVQLDQLKVLLPTFVALDLSRIPPINPSEADVCALATSVSHLRLELNAMTNLSAKVDAMMGQFDDFRKFVDQKTTGLPVALPVTPTAVAIQSSTGTDDGSTARGHASWAAVASPHVQMVSSLDDEEGVFELVSGRNRNRRSSQQPPVAQQPAQRVRAPAVRKVITGVKSSENNKVAAVPRPLVAFVGRLRQETSEQDLVDWLAESGIHDAKCRRLSAKNGRSFKTAAFRVACDSKYASLFYDESTWPAGCELRDWVFKNNMLTNPV